MEHHGSVKFLAKYESEEVTFSLEYPVFYTDFLKEVRSHFALDSSHRPILHYEHTAGIYRPLAGPDDFDLVINVRFHLGSFLVKLKISIDHKLPPIDVTTGSSVVRKNGTVRKTRNSGFFILEDVDDPILAPRINRTDQDRTGDPLLVYNSSFFVEELSNDNNVPHETTCPTTDCLNDSDLENWSLDVLLGQGGFGKVYVAITANQQRRLAVKVVEIDNEAEDEALHILDEIETLANLDHRNIVKYISCGRDSNKIYVFMELMEGGTISGYLKKLGCMTEPTVHLFAKQILNGLSYLHDNNIIHRDIKGSNLLLNKSLSIVKLADFGAAKKLSTLDRRSRYARSNATLVGTPYWMAPEVIRGQGAGRRSDIWSVGCTIVEMLTGVPPYKNYDPIAALFKIASTNPSIEPFNLTNISTDLQSFLTTIFVDVDNRPLVSNLRTHQWLLVQN